MCGIFGAIYNKSIDQETLLKCAKKLHHRGQEGFHYLSDDNYFIAHNRHIVIDVSQLGTQPFELFSKGQKLIWAMNSEIYNHEQLNQKCYLGKNLPTTSDSKTLGLLYQQSLSPKEICNMMDGKFSFILYDEKEDFLMIGRDPIGLCPLYWGQGPSGTIFIASELKAIESLCEYTIFPPGHFYTSTHGLQRYYEPSFLTQIPQEIPYEDDLLVPLKEYLIQAVQKRLMSDVPLAFLLSGGLDSSLVCSIVKRLKPDQEIHTFSIGIEGSPDLLAAREVAEFLKTKHHEYHFTVNEALDILPKVIYHIESYEQVRASVPMFILMQKIKEMGFKVILSGEGSDEIFGGYLYFHYCPSREEMQQELVRKVFRLHEWDVLRANKVGYGGNVEVRCPFLDKQFLEVAMNIDPSWKIPSQDRMEKYILRKAFDSRDDPFLPDSILWRQKEAFSDGVGYNWVDGLQKKAQEVVTDELWRQRFVRYYYKTPRNKEYYYLRTIFQSWFPSKSAIDTVPYGLSIACSTEEAIKWNPEWKDTHEISGRALSIHNTYKK